MERRGKPMIDAVDYWVILKRKLLDAMHHTASKETRHPDSLARLCGKTDGLLEALIIVDSTLAEMQTKQEDEYGKARADGRQES